MKLFTLRHAISHKPRADDFTSIDAPRPDCPEGGVVVRTVYLSLDPYVGSRLRGRHMGEAPPEPGKGMIPGAIVGEVVESDSDGLKSGDWVQSMEGGWAEYLRRSGSSCPQDRSRAWHRFRPMSAFWACRASPPGQV